MPATPPVIDGYQYEALLGIGGYSDVFLYEQQLPRMKVAVKVLTATDLTESVRRQFTAEANLMAKLSDHPYIVQVFRADITSDGRPYLIMKYYPNGNLRDRAAAEHLSVADVLRVGVQIGSAVHTAHAAGILHRDIKPANILVSQYGAPGLTDFGVAVAMGDELDDADGLSIPWAPPEVVHGRPADELSDVYSLGATLWNLLVGHSPFEVAGAGNDSQSLMQRIREMPVPPSGRDDVPAALERLLRQSMAKDAAARPSSALTLARGLQAIEQQEAFAVTHIPGVEALSGENVVRRRRAAEHVDDHATRVRPTAPPIAEPTIPRAEAPAASVPPIGVDLDPPQATTDPVQGTTDPLRGATEPLAVDIAGTTSEPIVEPNDEETSAEGDEQTIRRIAAVDASLTTDDAPRRRLRRPFVAVAAALALAVTVTVALAYGGGHGVTPTASAGTSGTGTASSTAATLISQVSAQTAVTTPSPTNTPTAGSPSYFRVPFPTRMWTFGASVNGANTVMASLAFGAVQHFRPGITFGDVTAGDTCAVTESDAVVPVQLVVHNVTHSASIVGIQFSGSGGNGAYPAWEYGAHNVCQPDFQAPFGAWSASPMPPSSVLIVNAFLILHNYYTSSFPDGNVGLWRSLRVSLGKELRDGTRAFTYYQPRGNTSQDDSDQWVISPSLFGM
jgi:hypothetical protein